LQLSERIELLNRLHQWLSLESNPTLEGIIQKAYIENPWFTPENINKSIAAISQEYLAKEKIINWVANYEIKEKDNKKKVAIIMAGNIPLVSWHDLQCSFIAGHETIIKCSSKDEVLISAIIEFMQKTDPRSSEYFTIVDRLTDYDAVIATGGDTAAVHFEYYFSKYPHIIRKNRNSVAILDGQETNEELSLLAEDVFDYFGLGCRSISKIYIPEDFNTDRLFEAFYTYKELINHNKYKNNFDYNNAIYILTQQPFLTNDFIILKEEESIASRIACLHYERYTALDEVLAMLDNNRDQIQCLSSRNPIDSWQHIPLGFCQKPAIDDYADHVDTMTFLLSL
jgi:hypothetical protein